MMKTIKNVALLGSLFWVSCLSFPLASPCYAAPDRLPAFQLPYLEGGEGTLSDAELKGKVFLLNLWASWCPGCKDEMPELMALQDQFAPEGFSVIAVNIDNKRDNASKFMEKFQLRQGIPLNFPVLYDASKILPKALGPTLLPTSYLVDPSGQIIEVLNGSITEERLAEVRDMIRSALGKP